MKKAIIIGATSGIGKEVAKLLIQDGWHVGIAGRREDELRKLQASATEQTDHISTSEYTDKIDASGEDEVHQKQTTASRCVEIQRMDITSEEAPKAFMQLIEKLGGMDLFFLSSGVGSQNCELKPDIELNTARTNVEGFIRMVTAAFNYFKANGGGHIAVISSIAGTKGLGVAPAYSATKRFQNTYIDALAQLASMQHQNIHFTDIRPGFVATDLLKGDRYPMLMKVEPVAREIVRTLRHKKRVIVINRKYRILVFFWRLIPRVIWERLPIKN